MLLANGLSRRIEGIQNKEPFEFNMGNVRADDELMNINSIDGLRNSYTAMDDEVVDSAVNATHKDYVTLPARDANVGYELLPPRKLNN